MKRATAYVILFDVMFVALLSVSGFFGGFVGEVTFYSSFIIPFGLAFLLRKNYESEVHLPRILATRTNVFLTLPLVFPTLALVFLISWLTSLALSQISDVSVSDVSGNIAVVILKQALLTALLEEALFRYIPIAYLAPVSKKGAVIFSAVFFALVHCNLYQLPYALAAGIIFAALDIAFDSIMPSFILHLLNNLLSIFWIRESANQTFAAIYISVLLGLAALSIIPIVILRSRYAERVAVIFRDKTKIKLTAESVIFISVMLVMAVLSL